MASKHSGSCSSPRGPARERSGRPDSQANTWFAVAAPLPPPTHSAAARVLAVQVADDAVHRLDDQRALRRQATGAPTSTP